MKKSLLFLFVLFSIIHNAQILYDNGAIDENNLKYELDGRKWNKSNLTYYFENGTNDISGDNERLAIKEAFSVWSNASNLTFTEVFSANNADIVIKWATGNHGDGSSNSFDGTNGVLAHAFFPPPNSGDLAGDVHFDDAESWTDQFQYTSSQPIDLITVAIHEIGHSLGLKHSQDSNAIMYAYYYGSRRQLHDDDILAIRSLYPRSTNIVVGNNSLCIDEVGDFKVLATPLSTDNVVWSFSSNLQQIPTFNQTLKVKALSNGSATISARINNGSIINKKIIIGKPIAQLNYNSNNNYVHLNLEGVSGIDINDQGITNVTWQKIADLGGGCTGSLSGNGLTGLGHGNCFSWKMKIRITITNPCGSQVIEQEITPRAPDPCDNYRIANNGNQNSSYRIILPCEEIANKNKTSIENDLNTIVTDALGNIVINTNLLEFNLDRNIRGTYYAKIIKNGKIIHTQTLIKK